MKQFCECTEKWELGFLQSEKDQQQVNYSPDYNMDYAAICGKCHYWKWYSASYENMIFDLKNMNN